MKKIFTLFSVLVCALGMMAADVLNINFTQGQGNWTLNNVNLDGLSYVWQQTSSYGMKASAYAENTNHATESWLVSPVFDLRGATSATLSFSHARKYGDNSHLHVIATNDPDLGWTDLTVSDWPDGSSWAFINATADLTAFAGSSTVQVAFVYTSTTSGAATWEIKTVNVSAEMPDAVVYYLAGSMNDWAPAAGYQFMENPDVDGEYTLDVTLRANDEFKVIETINGNTETWYPDGMNNNCVVSETGNYTVRFRPDGNLEGGYYGFYIAEKKIYPRYDVAEVIAAGLQTNEEIEVRGVVSRMEIRGSSFATYGSVIFFVTDANGEEGEFEYYNCYSFNADVFTTTDPAYDAESMEWVQLTSVSDADGNTVNVGDTVTAFGKYQLYNNTVHELNTGCYLIDVQHAVIVPDTIVLDYAYSEAVYYPSDNGWMIYAYNLDDNNEVEYPYLRFGVIAKSATALSGVYDEFFAGLYGENNEITSIRISQILMIMAPEEGTYRYVFSFAGSDNNIYRVDITTYMSYVYNNDTYEEIALNEDKTAYYLVGSMNDWAPADGYQFEANPAVGGEYKLNVTLAEGDEFKVVGVLNDNTTWYPGGQNNNYVVSANEAGERTVYFRPEGNTDWEEFHEGGFFYVFIPQDIYLNVTSDVTYLDNTATFGWWEMLYQNEDYKIVLSNASSEQAPGVYTVEDLDSDYSYIAYTDGATVHFTDGSVTLAVDENSGNVTVSGTLTGDDGNYYHIYILYVVPVAMQEAEIIVTEAVFEVYGLENDTVGVSLGIWSATRPGTYTKDSLYYNFSYIYLSGAKIYVYDADIIVTENEDGSYTVTADLLCENNTLYHVTMTVPVPEETAVANTAAGAKAVKVIRNGQFFVIKNGIFYNAQGAVVK